MGGKKKKFQVKTWHLCLILIPLLFLAATLLRIDHLKMVELRDAVFAADEEEDDEKLAAALEELKNFTFNNIVINVIDDNGNQKITFGTGVFYLEHKYQRDAEATLTEAEANLSSDENPNGNIYAKATAICKPQAIQNGWVWSSPGYIECVTTEIQKYDAADNLIDQISASLPSTELYRKNYASPLWAPSFSGFILLAVVLLVVVIFMRFLIWVVLRLSLLFL